MWETIRGYLTFTRKERTGVLFLLVLIGLLFLLPYFFGRVPGDPDPAAFEKYKAGIRKFESGEQDPSGDSDRYNRYQGIRKADTESGKMAETYPVEMFYFDPNHLTAKDWQRLGISERLTRTVLHYVEKGGRFRKAGDLKKLYGLHPSDYQRLLPYVRITVPEENQTAPPGYFSKNVYSKKPEILELREKKADSPFRLMNNGSGRGIGFLHSAGQPVIIDINTADSAEWCRLPGIGRKLASRITRFREKLGGFYRVEQVAETFGLPDSTFQKIKSCLLLKSVSLQQIDLNKATPEMLQAHPYIRWQIARGITRYRDQHGGFQSVGEILQVAQMDPEKFEKVKPYLTVSP